MNLLQENLEIGVWGKSTTFSEQTPLQLRKTLLVTNPYDEDIPEAERTTKFFHERACLYDN